MCVGALRCVPLSTLKAGGCVPCALDAGGHAPYATLYAVGNEGWVLFAEAAECPEVLKMMRCVLLRIMEAAKGRLCLLEVPNVPMRCVLGILYCFEGEIS